MGFKWFTLLQFVLVRSNVLKFVRVVLGYFSMLFLVGCS